MVGQRSVGHAGTLDPAATGVLPVAVGSALRALEYLADATKSYEADITFGLTTDALDIEGRLSGVCASPALTARELQRILDSLVGRIEQVPPVYSAIKIDGTPLYERARRGELIEPPKRTVEIHRMRLVRWEPPVATIDIDCSKGFYVRSFARDLGERLHSCGFLSNLVRTRVGPFDVCDAWTLDELASAPLGEEWERIAIAPDATAIDLPAVLLDDDRVVDWECGKRWALDDAAGEGPVRVYDSAGAWLGIGELTRDENIAILHPRKVIPTRTLAVQEND